MKRFDWVALAAILCVATALRVWAPWADVLGSSRVNFLETDAWYHVRLVENAVRNFPHHVTFDPYASPDGQYVAVAPLFDTIVATVVFVTRGSHAGTSYIERVAALAPPIMGVLAIVAVWVLATRAFGRREGLLAAFLAAILPGHFLDRTLLGFVDHHALEALLMFSVLSSLAGSREPGTGSKRARSRFPVPGSRSLMPGVFLGLYLLAWTSGALFVAILGAWLVTFSFIGKHDDVAASAKAAVMLSAVALVMVIAFQDPHLYRYSMQVVSLSGLLVVSVVMTLLLPRVSLTALRASIVGVGAMLAIGGVMAAPGLARQVLVDVMRLSPDPSHMTVLEARPLFLYSGNWQWNQPWEFFRTGFYVGAIALACFAVSAFQSKRADHWLILIVTASMFAATVGQNRFGYYLVPAYAVVIAWLSVRVLDWGGVPHAGNPSPSIRASLPMQREIAVMLVAAVTVAPNLVPAAITTTRSGGMPGYWSETMEWLRTKTPQPFASEDFYLQRYDISPPQTASYTVMNWWDQGYWILQAAHRVPVSNPTQAMAGVAARFYVATDEAEGLAVMASARARYALVDWELPFRDGGSGALAGRFENLAAWAGRPTSDFYRVCFAKSAAGWQPVWLFREAYYRTLAYRLAVLGGAAASPVNNTWLVHHEERADSTGRTFCEVTERQVYRQADEAKAVAAQKGQGYEAVGLTPWQPAFQTPAITGLRLAHEVRQPGQAMTEAPLVRIFERVQRGLAP